MGAYGAWELSVHWPDSSVPGRTPNTHIMQGSLDVSLIKKIKSDQLPSSSIK